MRVNLRAGKPTEDIKRARKGSYYLLDALTQVDGDFTILRFRRKLNTGSPNDIQVCDCAVQCCHQA